jgi:hypothetical protein
MLLRAGESDLVCILFAGRFVLLGVKGSRAEFRARVCRRDL